MVLFVYTTAMVDRRRLSLQYIIFLFGYYKASCVSDICVWIVTRFPLHIKGEWFTRASGQLCKRRNGCFAPYRKIRQGGGDAPNQRSVWLYSSFLSVVIFVALVHLVISPQTFLTLLFSSLTSLLFIGYWAPPFSRSHPWAAQAHVRTPSLWLDSSLDFAWFWLEGRRAWLATDWTRLGFRDLVADLPLWYLGQRFNG